MTVTPQQLREDIEEQFELPDLPPPMTRNRAIDFAKSCNRCRVECDYCKGWKDFDPLGR